MEGKELDHVVTHVELCDFERQDKFSQEDGVVRPIAEREAVGLKKDLRCPP